MEWKLSITGNEDDIQLLSMLFDILKTDGNPNRSATQTSLTDSHATSSSGAEEERVSKYSPLYEMLVDKELIHGVLEDEEPRGKSIDADQIYLTLELIEELLPQKLFVSAYRHDAFWRDRKRNAGRQIVRAGWRVQDIQRDQNDQITALTLRVDNKRFTDPAAWARERREEDS